MRTVTVICTGNLCRSPMAEGLLAAHLRSLDVDDVQVLSAGTHARPGTPVMPEAVYALRSLHVDLADHRAQRLDTELVETSDLLLCATEAHRDLILTRWRHVDRDKVRLFNDFILEEGEVDVSDPMGFDQSVFDLASRVIDKAMEAWAHQLKAARPGQVV